MAEWSIALGCKPSGYMPTGVQIPPGAQISQPESENFQAVAVCSAGRDLKAGAAGPQS